ncbi:MAG TPA: CapA family protein [Stellaceae bacterium]|nr:CapA family protein [Stellaceae bacterium]
MTDSAILALVGDVMLGRGVSALLRLREPQSFWGDVLPVLRSADAVIANLESPITEAASEWRRSWKAFRFRAAPSAIEVLRAANIRCVNLANNHALDYDERGLRETLDRLDAGGIAYAGAGRNLPGAVRPALVDLGGMKLGLIGMTDTMPEFAAGPRRAGTNVQRIDDTVASLGLIALQIGELRRAGADTVVLSVHWGPNLRTSPPARFRRFARGAIELGVDIVHGHSAHLIQGVERWGSGLILYDTGNFLDDYWVFPGIRIDRSFVFLVELRKGKPARLCMRPVKLKRGHVDLAVGTDFASTVATMRRRSRPFATPLLRTPQGLVVTWPSGEKEAPAGFADRPLNPFMVPRSRLYDASPFPAQALKGRREWPRNRRLACFG